jgi:hypothetical protein
MDPRINQTAGSPIPIAMMAFSLAASNNQFNMIKSKMEAAGAHVGTVGRTQNMYIPQI